MVPRGPSVPTGGDHDGFTGPGPLPPPPSAVTARLPSPTAEPARLTARRSRIRVTRQPETQDRTRGRCVAQDIGGVLVMQTLRFDPFRDFDRLAAEVLGTARTPALMPMDCLRTGDQFVVRFDQ